MKETGSLQEWIGREEQSEDVLDPRQVRLMQSILPGCAGAKTGDPLPPLWIWLYFPVVEPLDRLGADGHPVRGGFLPPVRLPRRMWAGGRLEFPGDLHIGDTVNKSSQVIRIVEKSGQSGPLCFVTVRHSYSVAGVVCLREEHDIVYRADPSATAGPAKYRSAPDDADAHETIQPGPVLLFRYSALTFNGHRIHYDRDYCRDVEGYEGLVVHGPLVATLLADFARRHAGSRMSKYSFRAVSPLFDTAPFSIAVKGIEKKRVLWAASASGQLAMQAEADFE